MSVNANVNLDRLNSAPAGAAEEELQRCCGSSSWVEKMLARRPFSSRDELFDAADDIWFKLPSDDWLEAFLHHPKIGDVESLRAKFASTANWCQNEQQGVQQAEEDVLAELASLNDVYLEKFGFIFIVCATGKSASEMLEILKSRLPNDEEKELRVAAGEQAKITKLRLEKLLT